MYPDFSYLAEVVCQGILERASLWDALIFYYRGYFYGNQKLLRGLQSL